MSEYTVTIQRSAQKALDKAPKNVKSRLIAAIDSLSREPRPVGCLKLTGVENRWRIREGEWRVIYAIYDTLLEVEVVEVVPRKDAY